MNKKFFMSGILVVVLFSTSICLSQVQQQWMKRFAATPTGTDSPKFIAVDDSGNVIVGGISSTYLSNRGEICVVKYNGGGDSLWTSIFDEAGSLNSDDINGLVIDKEQNIVITGYTHKPPDRDDDLFITTIKYDHQSGERMFLERYNNDDPNASDRGWDIVTDNGSNIYVSGSYWGGTLANGGTGYDMVVLSYSSIGGGVMVYRWQDSAASHGVSIAINKNGQVYALGYGEKDGKTVLRLVPIGGNFISYTLPETDWGISTYPKMILDREGNPIIITTVMGNATYLNNKLMLIKYKGGVQPYKTQLINSSYSTNTIFYDMAIDSSNNIIIAGGYRLANGSYQNFIKKFSPECDSIWTVFSPAVSTKFSCKIATDKQNSIYLTGNLNNMITIKYNKDGQEVWRAGEGTQFWKSNITLDNQYNVYVTGEKWQEWPGDGCTVKYTQNITGVKETKNVCAAFSLLQNYPNPFNPSTEITYQLPVTCKVCLKVYDMLGKEKVLLLDKIMPAGKHTVKFNAAGLPSGIYFYQLITGEYIQTRKMVIVK